MGFEGERKVHGRLTVTVRKRLESYLFVHCYEFPTFSSSSRNSIYHLVLTLIGILLTFSPMHFLGFNVMPRRIPDFPDSFHSWNFLSSIGSGITLLSFAI